MTAGDLYLSTRSGQRVQLLQPQPDSIDIGDIALGLSRQYRFNGHTTTPYTVAQHSVVVSYLVPAEHALQALLHDAAEAYIGDLPSPVKKLCPDFWLVEDRLHCAIMRHFGLPDDMPPSIKEADLVALATEKRDLMPHAAGESWEILEGISAIPAPLGRCWEPEEAREQFLLRFEQVNQYMS